MHEQVTLLRPARRLVGFRGRCLPICSANPPRLRILALLYALEFFLAGLLPILLVPADRAVLTSPVLTS